MDENAVELLKRSDRRFAARTQLDTLRQEIALNFDPVNASWTTQIVLGDDFASHLADGTPLLVARDFLGQIGAMLRPPGKQYFWHRAHTERANSDREIRTYCDWRSQQMKRIMEDRVTGYYRATKNADGFFGLYGDAVLSIDLGGRELDSLRIRNWHTKDVVWAEGHENAVDTVSRREMVSARNIKRRWGKREKGESPLSQKIIDACEKNPDQEFEVRHEVIPADEYDAYTKRGMSRQEGQWASVWIDCDSKTVLRETTTQTMRYVVPRWVTPPGWVYAISPATTIALPDARLIQQQAIAILEAAEKSINPPLTAVADTIRGDVRLDSRGITWIDRDYDQRSGPPVVPLELGKNFGLGVDSLMRTEQQLHRAFFLDVLRMPDTRSSKSTLEVQHRIDEYVRAALPLFAPMQVEYNDAMLFEVDRLIEIAGGYNSGPPMPKALKEEGFTFQWDNPLADMVERQKAQRVAEVSQLGQTIAALEAAAQQSAALVQIDSARMFRESVMGIGAADWLLDPDAAEEAIASQQEANQMAGMMQQAGNLAPIIDSGVNAAQVASTIPQGAEPGYPMLPAPG